MQVSISRNCCIIGDITCSRLSCWLSSLKSSLQPTTITGTFTCASNSTHPHHREQTNNQNQSSSIYCYAKQISKNLDKQQSRRTPFITMHDFTVKHEVSRRVSPCPLSLSLSLSLSFFLKRCPGMNLASSNAYRKKIGKPY